MNRKSNQFYKYIVLMILILLLCVVNILIGSVDIPVRDALDAIIHPQDENIFRDIIMDIRMPRVIAALMVGGALSLSGYSLQTFFHNPIAGPFILGISSGAKLIVALSLVFISSGSLAGYWQTVIASLIGAFLSIGFVVLCSRKVNNMALLLVCGVMIGYICTAITDLVVTFADDNDIVNLHNWSKGSLASIGWSESMIMSVVILLAAVGLYFIAKPMGAYIMGESYARSLGVNVMIFRILLISISGVLAAIVTAFAGPVSFVGIAVPAVMRIYIKNSSPKAMIPACFLGGAVFCLISDLIARQLFSPTELSISTVTAFFGAPVVIVMLLKRKKNN